MSENEVKTETPTQTLANPNPPREVELEVEIEEGKKEKVVLKRMTYGERNSVMRTAIGGKIRYMGEESSTIELDPFVMRELILFNSIKSPAKLKNMEAIRNLPADVGDLLQKKAEEINPFRSIL